MPRVSDEYLEGRRREILQAAGERFAKHGYRATHMRDVADAAGLSTGAVYRYFPTKEELFKAVIAIGRPAETALWSRLSEGDTPIEQLETLVDALARLAAESPAAARRNFRDYGEASQVPFLSKELTRGFRDIVNWVEGIVAAAQDLGEIDSSLEARTIATVLSTHIVALRFAVLFGGDFDVDEFTRAARRLLDGFRTHPR